MKLSTLAVPCLCVLIAACDPSVNVISINAHNEASVVSPASDQVPFTLRSSTLLLLPAGASTSANPSGPVKLTKCTSPQTASVKGQQLTPPSSPTLAQNSAAPATASSSRAIADWQPCLDNIQIVATPTRGHIYVATGGTNTTLSSTSMTNDPLLLKTVSVGQITTASNTITTMSTDVAAGMTMGGPWGIGIGSVAALYTFGKAVLGSECVGCMRAQNKNWVAIAEQTAVRDPGVNLASVVCPEAMNDPRYFIHDYTYPTNPTATLDLPIAIPVSITDSRNSKDDLKKCWMPLPTYASANQRIQPLWFYRIIATGPDLPNTDPQPSQHEAKTASNSDSAPTSSTNGNYVAEFPPSLQRDTDDHGGTIIPIETFLTEQISTSNSLNAFPTSACRTVEVDIAWWQELDKDLPTAETQSDALGIATSPRYKSYLITVADPRYVQLVNVQSNVVINFMPVCGAYASGSPSPTTTTDVFNTLIQAASTVMKAQQSASAGASK